MIVVSDTSAITSLLQIGRVQLLQQMYGSVFVPSAVEQELRCTHAALPDFIVAVPVHDAQGVARFLPQLHRGEAEAIALAKEVKANALLMDEKLGRAVAMQEGLRVIGLVGVLATAKMKGLIPSLAAALDDLETKADFRMSAALKSEALRSVGE